MSQFRPLSETKFINDANLVAYYPLNGNSNDAKGSVNGTDTAITYGTSYAVQSNFDQGANFNGSTSIINLGNTLNITGAITISAWVYITSTGLVSILGRGNGTNGDNTQYTLDKDASNNFGFYTRQNSAGAYFIASKASTINAWHHVVGTWQGGATPLQIYVDGVKGTDTANFSGTQGIGTTTQISKDGNGGNIPAGNGDDIAFFNRYFTASEVNELYQGMTLGEYLPNSNTKLLLHLNGNSTDSSGNGNNGTDTAITYVDGKFGKCASFNGSSSVIKIADHSSLDITGSMTVSTWVYLPNQIGTNVNWAFVGKTAGGSNRSWWMDYEDASGTKTIRLNLSNDGTAVVTKSVPYTFPTNKWVKVESVYDTSTREVKFYINGSQQGATQTGSVASIFNSTAQVEVGAIHNGTIYFLSGSQDEIVVEAKAKSSTEIAKDFTYQSGRYATL